MAKSILFVDDEPYYARHYVEALEKAGFDVVLIADPMEAISHLRANAAQLNLVILDYMMPTPDGVHESDTLDGLATGRWFLNKARDILEVGKEGERLPVLVLTNRNTEVVETEIADFLARRPDKQITVQHKTQVSRAFLPTLVKMLLRPVP